MDFDTAAELKQCFYKELDNIVAFHIHLTNMIFFADE